MIVGIAGRAGSGKGELIKYLCTKYPDKYATYAFADPLKAQVMRVFGLTQHQVSTQEGKASKLDSSIWVNGQLATTPRELLQIVGTQMRTLQGADYWVNKARQYMNTYANSPKCLLIDGVRFENEIAAIESVGGVLCWVDRDVPIMAHESERDMSIYASYLIGNKGTLQQFHQDIDRFHIYLSGGVYESV